MEGTEPAMTHGINGWGSYLPAYRLNRDSILDGAGKGSRVVASFDEDSTTMAVAALRAAKVAKDPVQLVVASSRPAYADKTNATAVHAAMGWDENCLAVDLGANSRSAAAAILMAHRGGGVAVLTDLVYGRPGSADESKGGDGAAAFSFGPDPVAVVEHSVSLSAEFTDRWSLPGQAAHQWEERFGATRYRDLIDRGLAALDLSDTPDRVVFSSPNPQVGARGPGIAGRLGTHPSPIGQAGSAGLGLALADALEQAGPGETILVISAADGCDLILLRTTDRITERRPNGRLSEQAATGQQVSYSRFLTWRGIIHPEPPRRPDPDRVAGPPAGRNVEWKFGLVGSRCTSCDMLHLPPERACKNCGALDQMTAERVADRRGRIATFTVDRLAFSPSPPLIEAVVDLDGGGRLLAEVADVDPEQLHVGMPVEFTFRKLFTSSDIHNYFWKVRPLP